MTAHRPLALVTGGSSGIGLELAKQFARNGFDLVISGSSDKVHRSAQELQGLGVECLAYQADASTYDGVQGLWEFVESQGRPLEAAALNVGIGKGGAFIDNELEDDFKLIAINITGTVHMAKRVARHMVANGKGRILITSSIAATTPTPYETVYGPSKAFGFAFAEALRQELRDTGVTVTAMLPGATDSDFHKNAGMASSKIGAGAKNDKTEVARQGFEALMNDVDHIVAGDDETRQQAEENRTTPETVKAERHAEGSRLRG